jgi:TrmH family RNA methyltransferase
LRTLGWFGGFECLLSPGFVDPFNSKVVRASMGAIFYVPLVLDAGIELVHARYTQPACLLLGGKSLDCAEFRHADCLIFGNEARGLPDQLIQEMGYGTYSIPGSGQIDSLNLAATVNMCVYELMRR